MKRFVPALLAASMSVAAGAPHGGWAAITVHDLPDLLVAGTPVDLRFTVRQHGMTPLDGLSAKVEARARNGRPVIASAKGVGKGEYLARITVSEPGDWRITIRSGFGPSDVDLLPIPAIAFGGARPAPLAAAMRGRALFVAKGCVSCHVHGELKGSGRFAVGPALTDTPLPPDYLAADIANPSIRPPAADGAQMPDLGVKPAEVAALVAFLRPDPRPDR
jgi:hypothetical protein